MGWILVKAGVEATERYVRDSEISEVRVQNQSTITLVDHRGQTFTWKTTGTMAEYARLAKVLGITDVA